MAEIWKPAPGYEGFYEVSDQGRIKRLQRQDALGRCVTERILSPHWLSAGVLAIQFNLDGQTRYHLVRLLVLQAFVGPRPKGYYPAHKNGDPRDNRLSNLEWRPYKRTLREQKPRKLFYVTTEEARRIREQAVYAVWPPKRLAHAYHRNIKTIYKILQGGYQ